MNFRALLHFPLSPGSFNFFTHFNKKKRKIIFNSTIELRQKLQFTFLLSVIFELKIRSMYTKSAPIFGHHYAIHIEILLLAKFV